MQRLVFIDYIKFFAIFLVVLGHLPLQNLELSDWIFSFHVPLFFFISGYLCKVERDWQDPHFISKNIKRLVLVTIPYFILDMIYQGMMDYVFYSTTFSVRHNIVDPLKYYFTCDSRVGPMWFLFALFWMRLAYNYLSHLIGEGFNIRMLIGSIVLSAIVFHTGFRYNYFQLCTTLIAFPFFCFGVSIKRWNILDTISQREFTCLVIAGISIAVSLLLLPKFGHLNINACQFGDNFLMYLLMPLLGMTFICMLLLKIRKLPELIKTISNGTLIILCTHFWLLQPFKLLYKKFLSIDCPPPYMDTFSGVIISFTILIILSYPISRIVNSTNSYIRFLAGK